MKNPYDNLSREDRIDKISELLAIGVMRLAQKKGLLSAQEKKPEKKTSAQSKLTRHKKSCSQ